MMRASDEDVFLAKWVYQSFATITTQSRGPVWHILPEAARVSDLLTPAFHKIVAQETQVGPGTVWVPSPWHAVLYLDAVQHRLSAAGSRALLRGQNNSGWAITSSLDRPGVDAQMEARKGRLFCKLLASLSFNTTAMFHPQTRTRMDLRIAPDSYWAAAQHYGIRTDLIDFTTDPTIAVFFACSGKDPVPGQTSSVFVLPLELALDRGCEVILPPPFVERLYIQRGLFIRHAGPVDKDEWGVLEIRFPSAFPFAPFQACSHAGVVNVLADSHPMQAVLSMVEHNPEPDSTEFEGMSRALKESFSDVYASPLGMWAKYVDFFEDQLYWLACRVDESSDAIVLDVLKPIVLANRELASGVSQFYKWAATLPAEVSEYSQEKRDQLQKLSDLLSDLLAGMDE